MKIQSKPVRVALLVLLNGSLNFVAPAFATEDKVPSPNTHNSYLENTLNLLSQRNLSKEEMSKLSAYIGEHPADADGHVVLSKAYLRMGLDTLYAEELEKAWHCSPGTLLYFLAALKVYAQGEERAKFDNLVEEAYKCYGSNAKVLGVLGKTFQSNSESELAFRFLKRAIDLEPKNVELLSDYCMTLLAQRKYVQLLSASKALEFDPQIKPLVLLLNGVANYNLHNTKKALEYLSSAYSTNYMNPEVAEAYYDALVQDGNYKAAVRPAILALAMQPIASKHLDTLKAKVKPVLARASDTELKSACEAVLKLLPPGQALAFFYFSLADILDKSGRYLAAAKLFDAGVQIFPYGRAYMRLAHDLEILGTVNDKQILAYYKQAALLSPGDEEVKARYLRMKARIPVGQTDIALKLKLALAAYKYQ